MSRFDAPVPDGRPVEDLLDEVFGASDPASDPAEEGALGRPRGGARRAGPERQGIKDYDFRRPEKFSRDHLRTLQGLHEQFVRLLNPALAAYLRTNVQFALEGVVQATYQDFTAGTKEANLIFAVSLDPLPTPVLAEVSAELVFATLDRLLGGVGEPFRPDREATELERSLFQEHWLLPALEALRGAWSSIVSVTPAVAAVETGSDVLQNALPIALPSDVVVVTEASATVGGSRGLLRLCYPYAALEPVVPQLDIQRLFAATSGADRQREADMGQVRRGLNAVAVPVVVRLGGAHISVAELLDLRVGDVVRLDTLVDQDVEVHVDGRPKFRGRPGLKRQHLAVRVSAVLDGESERGEHDDSVD